MSNWLEQVDDAIRGKKREESSPIGDIIKANLKRDPGFYDDPNKPAQRAIMPAVTDDTPFEYVAERMPAIIARQQDEIKNLRTQVQELQKPKTLAYSIGLKCNKCGDPATLEVKTEGDKIRIRLKDKDGYWGAWSR